MSSDLPPSCLVCKEHLGEVPVPGGLRIVEPGVITFHVPPEKDELIYLGHLLVTPQRHVADFSGLEDAEAGAVGIEIMRWSAALKEAGAERVYTATIGHGVAHLHVHLLPRWAGTPKNVPWHSIDDWPGANRVDFDAAAIFFENLRSR